MTPVPRLIGVVHLHPLPGAPTFDTSMEEVVEAAISDARALEEAGFDGVIVENFGDAPFFAEICSPLPPSTPTSWSKHAVAPPGMTIEQATAATVERSGADAVIVGGAATGDAPDRDGVRRAVTAADGAPVIIGSGTTEKTVGSLLEIANGVIVGTSLKVDGVTTNPVDGARAAAFVKAAG